MNTTVIQDIEFLMRKIGMTHLLLSYSENSSKWEGEVFITGSTDGFKTSSFYFDVVTSRILDYLAEAEVMYSPTSPPNAS